MALSISTKYSIFIFRVLVFVATLCFYTGSATDNPPQMIANALFCFNRNFIYSGCEEAYRLNADGNINVPFEATDLFCNGPCLVETQLVLNCVNNILSGFLFYNEATVRDIKNTLKAGCSYTSQRGDFNVARYVEGDTSNATSIHKPTGFYASVLTILCCFTIICRIFRNNY